MSNLQIYDKLYDVRFMLCLIFPYKEFLSSLQKLVDDRMNIKHAANWNLNVTELLI